MSRHQYESGFTLVELLIVVVVLGILASTAIPLYRTNTDDAQLSQLQSNLKIIREAVERYSIQHDGTYPGVKKTDGSGLILTSAAQCASAFVEQMTLYTDIHGETSPTKDATHKYGPYLKGSFPKNPFNGMSDVLCDLINNGLDGAVANDATGWKFYPATGTFHANDGDHKTY